MSRRLRFAFMLVAVLPAWLSPAPDVGSAPAHVAVAHHGTVAESKAGRAQAPQQTEPSLTTTLTGGTEVPGPGDPDGSGSATIRPQEAKGEICYELSVAGIGEATAAHIHKGAAGTAGPARVTLMPPATGSSNGCATGVNPVLIKRMLANPANFYLNVHNKEYPKGAVRGQLAKAEG